MDPTTNRTTVNTHVRERDRSILVFIKFLSIKFRSYSVIVLKIIIVFVIVLVNEWAIIIVFVLIIVHEYITAIKKTGADGGG